MNNAIVNLERAEINCHTNRGLGYGVSSPYDIVNYLEENRLYGIAITDFQSTIAFHEINKEIKRIDPNNNIKPLYGTEIYLDSENYICVIAKNKNGIKTINAIITALSDYNSYLGYKNTKKIINECRNDILLGLPIDNHFLINLAKQNDMDSLVRLMKNYDYVVVAPISTYQVFYKDETNEEIKKIIKNTIEAAKQANTICVASSCPEYTEESSKLSYSALYEYRVNEVLSENAKLHIYNTAEMKYAFDWLNDDDLVDGIVVTNTHKVVDMCEQFDPFDNKFHLPKIDNAYEKIEKEVYQKAYELYGNNLDKQIKDRIETELYLIKENNFASIYYLAKGVCDEIKQEGHEHGLRGMAGSSLVCYLLGISKCNPLPPHYLCPKCHRIEWIIDAASGLDLEIKNCPECNEIMIGDGNNIPYEAFMGLNGERVPDFDINIDSMLRNRMDDIIEKVAPNNKVFRAGTSERYSIKRARDIVDEYICQHEIPVEDIDLNGNELENIRDDLEITIADVFYKQGYQPRGFIIVPDDKNILEYTALTNGDRGVTCTQTEYYEMSNNLYKLDCLSHTTPVFFKEHENFGEKLSDIDIHDPKIIELLSNKLSYSNQGIHDFESPRAIKAIDKIKPNKFSDFVKISNLMHGTDVWKDNGELLIDRGIELNDIIASREDVFNILVKNGIDRETAFKIMERVRKGKKLLPEQEEIIRSHNMPEWFIDSCNTILYLFPKAHAVDYVIDEFKLAWMKIYKPNIFYALWFAFCADILEINIMTRTPDEITYRINELDTNYMKDRDLSESLSMAREMANRGIKLVNVKTIDNDENIEYIYSELTDDEYHNVIFGILPGDSDSIYYDVINVENHLL